MSHYLSKIKFCIIVRSEAQLTHYDDHRGKVYSHCDYLMILIINNLLINLLYAIIIEESYQLQRNLISTNLERIIF